MFKRICFEFLTLGGSGFGAGMIMIMALAISGCSSPLPIPTGNPTSDAASLKTFTAADLDNAEALATAQGDVIAQPCWPALKAYVMALPTLGPTPTGTTGLATVFQEGRGVVNPIRSGIPASLILACGPLASQVRLDVLTFLTRIAGGAAIGTVTGGLAPAVGIVPLP